MPIPPLDFSDEERQLRRILQAASKYHEDDLEEERITNGLVKFDELSEFDQWLRKKKDERQPQKKECETEKRRVRHCNEKKKALDTRLTREYSNGRVHYKDLEPYYDWIKSKLKKFDEELESYTKDLERVQEAKDAGTDAKQTKWGADFLMDTNGKRIRYCRVAGTVESLYRILDEKTRILHFSGHGKPYIMKEAANGKQIQKKMQSTQLVFENAKKLGESQEVDTKELKKLAVSHTGLQLVFVSACYSEAAGEIFRNAGVPYCICISQQNAVDAELAAEFTKIFYEKVLRYGKPIPLAFSESKRFLSTKMAKQQAEIFKLLRNEQKQYNEQAKYIKLKAGQKCYFSDNTAKLAESGGLL